MSSRTSSPTSPAPAPRRALGQLLVDGLDLGDAAAGVVAAAAEVEVAPGEGGAVEVVVEGEVLGEAVDALGGDEAVFVQDEGGLEVVVERDDARAETAELRGGRLAIEVDEDALDHRPLLDVAREAHGVGDGVLVAAALAHRLGEGARGDVAGADVGVERVDEGVGLGVVAEEDLPDELPALALHPHLAAAAEERGELVAELAAQGAEAEAEDVLQVGLERERRPADAIEPKLLREPRPELLGAAREDVDLAPRPPQLTHQGGGAGHGPLLVGALDRRADQIAGGVEVGAEVGLVEVPAGDEGGHRRPREPHPSTLARSRRGKRGAQRGAGRLRHV